jgi:hypothetical protein
MRYLKRDTAKMAGYYVREGSYHGTTDDRISRWYFGNEADIGFRPYGAGYPTRLAAWEAAYDHGMETGVIGLVRS